MNVYFEWVGSICGILGALLISSNTRISPWGWWLFLASSLSLCFYAVFLQAWGLLMLNGCFVLTNLIGLIRWWLPMVLSRREPFGVPDNKLISTE